MPVLPSVTPLTHFMENEHYDFWGEVNWPTVQIAQVIDEYEDDEEELEVIDLMDPTEAPDPLPILARLEAESLAAMEAAWAEDDELEVIDSYPENIDPTDAPNPQNPILLGMMATARSAAFKKGKETKVETQDFTPFEEDFFNSEPAPQEEEHKPTWLDKFTQKLNERIGKVMEGFGKVLDVSVPVGSMATLAAIAGMGVSTIGNFEKTASASEPDQPVMVQTVDVPQISVSMTQPATTLWSLKPEPKVLNAFLIEKNPEIVQHAGGSNANYLHSGASYAHFTKSLESFGGFSAILAHPEVAKAKNIAEMINLVEKYFGEKVADLVESNAAAMNLSAQAIAQITK